MGIYEQGKPLTNIHKGSGETPTPEDGYYRFTGKVNFSNESKFDVVICAAPYIDTVYFLTEIQYSVRQSAEYYLNHLDETNVSKAALNYIVEYGNE